jgi:hypothetical protein
MNNDLIVERLANLQHQALLREAESYRQQEPAVTVTETRRMRKLLLALSCALPLARLAALVAPLGTPIRTLRRRVSG